MKLAAAILLLILGAVAATSSSVVLEATNTTEFCTSCHSMQWVEKEWMESEHYMNVYGVRAGCSDCHVPHPLGPKMYAKLRAAKDVWHEILGTIDDEQKFEQHRWTMANAVWERMKKTGSRECESCHTIAAMDLKEQDRSARKKHRTAETRGKTCIDCHKGVAHKLPKKPDSPEEELALNQAGYGPENR